MKKVVRFIAQCIDTDSGDIMEESIMNEEVLSKAETLNGLGYTHIKQIDFLQKIQDFKIKHQSSREPLYRDSLSHHRTSDVAYGGFAVMFTKS